MNVSESNFCFDESEMADVNLTPMLVQQYEALQSVREEWSNSHIGGADTDRVNETIILDGNNIDSVPGFYLALGEAVNGPNGYFGACLDSLSDCLCGGFGLALPITVEIRNSYVAREHLGPAAFAIWKLLRHQRITRTKDPHDDHALLAAATASHSLQSYFDLLLDVFQGAGVKVRLREHSRTEADE